MSGASSSSSISSTVSLIPTGPQVFINFRGKDIRKSFISFLVPALKEKNINVFIDEREERGKYLLSLFERIGESKIALVIFSEGYAESKWCLDELVQIKECMDEKKLTVIPVFYKLDPSKVKHLRGRFGDKFRDLGDRYQHEPDRFLKWTDALTSVCQKFALTLSKYSDTSERDFIRSVVKAVKQVLPKDKKGANEDGFSVPARKLTITMHEAPNTDEAFEVSVLNEVCWLNNMTENFNKMKIQSPETNEFKFWVHNRPSGNTFTINARELSIEWSDNPDHWSWLTLPNQMPNEPVVEAAFLEKASWLDVAGKFDTRYLSPRTRYEVLFEVMLIYTTFEWETPVKLKLILPSNSKKLQERSVDMGDLICNEWVDIPVGEQHIRK